VTPRALGGLVALTVFASDQAAKFAVLSYWDGARSAAAPLAPFLDLALRLNRGISFSLFVQDTLPGRAILLALTLGVTAFLAWWLSKSRSLWAACGLGAIIGGALGNAVDRVAHGAVVDYLDLHLSGRHFFVFNLADAAINVGVALLIVDVAFVPRAATTR
jgi:lipoprotein signal peptidase